MKYWILFFIGMFLMTMSFFTSFLIFMSIFHSELCFFISFLGSAALGIIITGYSVIKINSKPCNGEC